MQRKKNPLSFSLNKKTKMLDRNTFNNTVYTTLSEALQLLDERRKNPELIAKVEKLLKSNIPEIFKKNKCGIMARQLSTPNYESKMFIDLASDTGLHPVFLEYFDDKFTSNNKYKHSLGQLHIQNKINNGGNECIEKVTIIDFNKSNGKKIREIKTLWGEYLIDFHRKLFSLHNLKNFSFFEETSWYEKTEETPSEFYENFFLLITCFGILFENFLLTKDDPEEEFTKNVILPAIEKVKKLTGLKPLIVPFAPLDLEADPFWYYHLPIIKKAIPGKK